MANVDIQKRILKFVTVSNWLIFFAATVICVFFTQPDFYRGIIFGGLIVTVNFQLLYRTLKKSLTPPHLTSHSVVIAKYYVRFIVSGILIFILLAGRFVNPVGLIIGLSIVVASIFLATLSEIIKHLFKEAV